MTINTRWLLALTLTLMVGCSETDGPSNNNPGGDADVDADSDADSDSDSDSDFNATFNIVAPEGRTGTFYLTDYWFSVNKRDDDIVCADTEECIVEVTKTDDYDIWFDGGEGYDSLVLEAELIEKDNGSVFDLTWGEGEHGVTPCGDYVGEYGDYEVCTTWEDDLLVMDLSVGPDPIMTGTTFYGEDDDEYIDGTISDNLSTIDFARERAGRDWSDTLHLR